MKVIPAVRWFLEAEQVKELEAEFETLFDYVRHKILMHLTSQIAEIDTVINYLAWLMFDPKDEEET